MRKAILAFVLFIIFVSFTVFLLNAFVAQKKYFDNLNTKSSPEPLVNDVLEKSTPSTYLDYSKDEYDKAFAFRGVTVLYFTSNWCQACLDQDVINNDLFNDLVTEGITNVFGLRVHILDSETTTETDALSQKFDVTKEQSFVILDKSGAVFFKHTGFLSKDQLKQKLMEAR